MGARVAKLVESDVGHIKDTLSDMESDVKTMQQDIAGIRASIPDQANKIIMFTATLIVAAMAITIAVVGFA